MFAFSEGLQVFACQKKKKKLKKKKAKFLKVGNSFLKKTFEKRVLFFTSSTVSIQHYYVKEKDYKISYHCLVWLLLRSYFMIYVPLIKFLALKRLKH